MPEPDTIAADGVITDAPLPQAPEGPAPQTPALTPRAEPSGALDHKLARLSMFMDAASNPAIDIVKLNALRAMAKEEDADERKREYFTALAQAKAEFPPIVKTRLVDYAHKDGRGRTSYKYEELADITDVVVPILAKYGITHSFKVDQSTPPLIKVSCTLAHANGYEDTPRTLEGLEDTSGQKSPNQAITSTITFLERATLKQALGLAAGRDDDGRGGDPDPMITPDDVVYIETLIAETGSDLARLLKTVGADSVAEMRASQFKQAAWLLETVKRRDKKKTEAAADGTAQ